jgi:hypothetical protein
VVSVHILLSEILLVIWPVGNEIFYGINIATEFGHFIFLSLIVGSEFVSVKFNFALS